MIYKRGVIDWCSDGQLSLILRKVCFLPAHVALGLIRAPHVETPGCPVLCRESSWALSVICPQLVQSHLKHQSYS